MRTRINNITFTPGTRSITTGITDLTVDDVRLFINESQMKVICSSMLKSNIDSIVSGVVTYKNTFPVLVSGDHITFEVDLGDNVAKQGSNPDASLTSIDEKIDDIRPLAHFFGVTELQGYEFMTDTEVTDELEDIMQALDPELTAEQAASITAEAMQIINNDEEQS